ncbi:hypothetical protein SPMU_15030 [Sphingomonas mucosissima]|uniref:Glycosyltransferase RgtA/B/C/D-like domain-containing protein n=2 Tax=Sphingomonas mucosissima TaxID=370959 RepID=A0A245ZLA1_9SPHN|nr:hypothetical protein SPMU_15030 [Sphingomonas mucosissima]
MAGSSEAGQRARPLLLIIAFTLLYRSISFGDPMIAYDEQLYLLVGDRMLQGQLPYVDLWDRKPIGLFLFYAGVRLLGGDGIIQYQVVAALCVAATACLIWTAARRSASPVAALIVALCYVVLLPPLQGGGGQAPVIYNVLTMIGAWACFRASDKDHPRQILPLAMLAMATSGIAIQFKYTPAVEGALFGCYFLWCFHRCGTPLARLAGIAAAMVLVALIPTIAAVAYFWWIGELSSYVQANFVSVFQRNPFPVETRTLQRWIVLIIGGPLLLLGVLAAWQRRPSRTHRNDGDYPFVLGWSLSAIAGFGLLGDFYDFYFITVLPPVLVLVAPLLQARILGLAAGIALLIWPMLLAPLRYEAAAHNRARIDQLVTALRPFLQTRCLYVYDGPAVLYLLTNACAPSRYIYPDHLQNPTEAPALGVDPVTEVRRILASRPGAIVTADRPVIPRYNPNVRAALNRALAQDYVTVARVKLDRVYEVHALRPLARQQHAGPALTAAPL